MATPRRVLTKAHAELLMSAIDTDRFIDALQTCLMVVVDHKPNGRDSDGGDSDGGDAVGGNSDGGDSVWDRLATWRELVERAGAVGHWSSERVRLVAAMDTDALYDLCTELNERRALN